MKCPKCGVRQDGELYGSEIVFQKCGHTFTLEYEGYYDDTDRFHSE